MILLATSGCPRPGRDHQRRKLITLFTNKPCPTTAEARSRRNLATKSLPKEDRPKPPISSTFPACRHHLRPLCDVRLTVLPPSSSTLFVAEKISRSSSYITIFQATGAPPLATPCRESLNRAIAGRLHHRQQG